ncbi:hypothetical protein [uncultured Subdoligranulum sp.]|uniref:hypothetical protein n=1 Tax=uncultured Subdoligranulum sp. TaxID=512298 RepID=UPI00262384D7|nr:hypothetical protein [uncultured Subdoligranulum sp.]
MSPRTGRPTQNKKTERLEIRLTPEEAQRLEKCAQKMQASKTEVINEGVKLLEKKLEQ